MKVLLFAIYGIPSAARLAKPLRDVGFQVAVLCPSSSIVATTRHVDRRFCLKGPRLGRTILSSLTGVVNMWGPDLIVAGDQETTLFLQRVVELAAAGRLPHVNQDVLATITRSLGDLAGYRTARSKIAQHAIMTELGFATPVQTIVESVDQAVELARLMTYPVVLKLDGRYGGDGVAICRTDDDIRSAWGRFRPGTRNRDYLKTVTRRLLGDELGQAWACADAKIIVQQFIPGTPATHCLVAYQGEVLTGFSAVAEQANPWPHGPSTVVRLIENSTMRAASAALIRRLGLTGFAGLDFILEAGASSPWFLECNPRLTQICHLGRYVGRDLCDALFHRLNSQAWTAGDFRADAVVALFPQEWMRDPISPYFESAIHDVPWDDPGFIEHAASRNRTRLELVAP
jgi:carbamoyl-phosphate synthase large subunit